MFSIREASTLIMKELTQKFGGQWASTNIVPKMQKLQKDTNYLQRMTCLFCLNTLSEAMTQEQILKEIMPIVKDVGKFYFFI